MTEPQIQFDQGSMSDPLLRRPEVEQETGLKKSAIYAGIAAGTFPKPIRVTGHAVRWRASAIEQWKTERELQTS